MLNVETIDLFYGASHALRRVSLTAEVGKVTCVLGRNGVGKTSLLRAIFGLQAIRAGKIMWEGENIAGLKPHERARKGLAIVPQGRDVFPRLTVYENMITGFAPLAKQMRTIPEEIYQLFPVLKSMLNRRGGDLSGGQQQQLAIARALITRPRLLILDEPTEGIQPSIIKDIGRALQFLRDDMGMTILLVEQFLDFCRELADDIYVMDRGEILHAGPAADLDKPEVRRHLMV